MKKEIYVLIGPAAIGKTTYINNTGISEDKRSVVSRDEVVAVISKKYDLDFDDLYIFPPKQALIGDFVPGFEKHGRVIESPQLIRHLYPISYEYINNINAEIYHAFYNTFQHAIRTDSPYIFVDRVHMRKEERVSYFPFLEPNRHRFYVTAVLFNFEDADTLDIIEKASEIRRSEMAKTGRFRTVPRKAQENMIRFYQEPTLEEGFDAIIKVDTLPKIREFINSPKKRDPKDCQHAWEWDGISPPWEQDFKCPYCDLRMDGYDGKTYMYGKQ